VENHSYKLSPLGPAVQLGGGSRVISASSFWMRFADVLSTVDNCFLVTDCFVDLLELGKEEDGVDNVEWFVFDSVD